MTTIQLQEFGHNVNNIICECLVGNVVQINFNSSTVKNITNNNIQNTGLIIMSLYKNIFT